MNVDLERLLGLVKSCTEAIAYVNEQLSIANNNIANLTNDYLENVLYTNPVNGIALQSITTSINFGVVSTTPTNIPTFTFGTGSKLRYANVLNQTSQTDGLELVNYQTLVNYIGNSTIQSLAFQCTFVGSNTGPCTDLGTSGGTNFTVMSGDEYVAISNPNFLASTSGPTTAYIIINCSVTGYYLLSNIGSQTLWDDNPYSGGTNITSQLPVVLLTAGHIYYLGGITFTSTVTTTTGVFIYLGNS